MSEFLRNRHVTASRKEHRCYDCEKVIFKGSACLYSSSRFDGYFVYGHFCYNCVPDKKPKELLPK